MKPRTRAQKRRDGQLQHPAIQTMTTTVENPLWSRQHEGASANPRFIEARINIKESAVGTLAARKLIDVAQAEAATRFRRYWEATGGAGVGAMDYARDKVDGGQIADPIDIAQMKAAKKLAEAELTLGERNYDLVRKVCGEGHAMTELFAEKRDRLTAADNLRASLDDLCRIWGVAGVGSDRPRRNHDTPRHELKGADQTAFYTSRTTKAERRAKKR